MTDIKIFTPRTTRERERERERERGIKMASILTRPNDENDDKDSTMQLT